MTASSYRRYLASFAPGLAMSLGLLVLVAVLFWQLLSVSDSTSSLISNLGPRDWQVVRFTTLQAGLSVILSLMVGLPLAWALAQQRTFPGRSLLIAVFSSALVLPTLVVVLGLVTVLGRAGWLNMALEQSIGTSFGVFLYGFSGVLIAHTYLNGSFAVRAILNRLEAIPVEKQKLSTSLGLSTWHHFLLVEWPAMRSTLPGISALIFLMCFTSFAIVLTLGGNPSFNTLEVAIYEAAKFDFDIPRALDLALLQLAICAVFVIFASSFRASHGIIGQRQSHGFRRPGRAIGFFQLALITLLAICFLLPLLAILIDGLRTDFGRLFGEATFLKALATSLVIATSSSLLTVVVAIHMALAKRNFSLQHRLAETWSARLINPLMAFSGSLYLAFPSVVLGLGFFVLARQFSGSLYFWSWVALLTANVLMALPLAIGILVPAMEKTALRHDRLAFSLGLGGWNRWRIAEWPLVRADIGYVFAIAFCLSMGDLGVIALFGNQDFATLPWYLYQKMGSYRTDDAAGIALVMLTITLVVFLAAPRLFAGRR